MEKIYYIPTDKKVLCLTFDDGINNPTTSIILDILKNYNIKATFFVLIENVLKYPDILKRVINDEHSVGLHGLNHISYRKHYKSKIYRHIKKGIKILRDSFGVNVQYVRLPYGTFPQDAETVCKEFNLTPVGWTIMENDYKPYGVQTKSNNIIKRCSAGKVLVLHDGYRCLKHNGATIEILKNILPQLIAQGYSFVSIPELVSSKSNTQHKTFNNIPLLHHEIIDFTEVTTLFLYWDVNYIKNNDEYFNLRIIENNIIKIDEKIKYPDPFKMEEWPQKIVFPLSSITKNSEIFISDKNKNFLLIKI